MALNMEKTDIVFHGGWDSGAEHQVQSWVRITDLNSATNELAALYYQRLYKAAVMIVSILTVVVGSKGLATLIMGKATVADIVVSICEIILGIFATLLSSMELKNKGESFSKRSIGYAKLASALRIQLVLRPEERETKLKLLESIPARVEHLEEMTEPLPLRYRRQAEKLMASTHWNVSTRIHVIPAPDLPTPHAYQYDAKQDGEGSSHCILQTIMQQRL
jgi:hypothetical protein